MKKNPFPESLSPALVLSLFFFTRADRAEALYTLSVTIDADLSDARVSILKTRKAE